MTSRAEVPPTPAELTARCVVADVAALAGVFRWQGSFTVTSAGFGRHYTAGGPRGDARFVAAGGGRIRVEDDLGLLRLSDGVRTVVRDTDSGALVEPRRVVVGIGPERLLRPELVQPEAVAATTCQGRPAWEVRDGRTTAVLDDATAIALATAWHQENGDVGGRAELLDLDWAPDLAATVFLVPDVPAWTPPARPGRPEGPEPDRDAWGDRARPTTTWTPSGLPSFPVDGDLATGWLVQQVRCLLPSGPAYLHLHRRPDGVDAPLPADGHRWHADGCDWLLEPYGGEPLTPAELAAMAASVDTALRWPA